MKTRLGYPLPPMLFNILLEVLATAIKQGKEIMASKLETRQCNSLFTDDMIVYIGKPIDSTKNLLNIISEFNIRKGYKVNIQKLKSFCTPTHKYQSQKLGKKFIH